MADKTKIVPGSAPGDFFVDTSCIHCSNCRDLAPRIFDSRGIYLAVVRQPETPEEILQSLKALVCCPTGSIGTHEKHEVKPIIDLLPEQIVDGIYYFGFNSAASAGGKSYFFATDAGNWMVDSPKFSPRLVKWIEEKGGLNYIFLTHRDDVAEAASYAKKFGARRIIHHEDLEAQPDAEIVLEGDKARTFEGGVTAIPQRGHTEGHCMLLYKTNLFSGDVFTCEHRFGEALEVWEPFYCWWSWEQMTESLEELRKYSFELTLPAHGRRTAAEAGEMQRLLDNAIKRCQAETDTDPCSTERADVFLKMADSFRKQNQPVYAGKMEKRAEAFKSRLAASIRRP